MLVLEVETVPQCHNLVSGVQCQSSLMQNIEKRVLTHTNNFCLQNIFFFFLLFMSSLKTMAEMAEQKKHSLQSKTQL